MTTAAACPRGVSGPLICRPCATRARRERELIRDHAAPAVGAELDVSHASASFRPRRAGRAPQTSHRRAEAVRLEHAVATYQHVRAGQRASAASSADAAIHRDPKTQAALPAPLDELLHFRQRLVNESLLAGRIVSARAPCRACRGKVAPGWAAGGLSASPAPLPSARMRQSEAVTLRQFRVNEDLIRTGAAKASSNGSGVAQRWTSKNSRDHRRNARTRPAQRKRRHEVPSMMSKCSHSARNGRPGELPSRAGRSQPPQPGQ